MIMLLTIIATNVCLRFYGCHCFLKRSPSVGHCLFLIAEYAVKRLDRQIILRDGQLHFVAKNWSACPLKFKASLNAGQYIADCITSSNRFAADIAQFQLTNKCIGIAGVFACDAYGIGR